MRLEHTDFTFESLYPRTPNFYAMLHLGPKGLEEAYQTNSDQFKADFQAAGLTRSKDPLALAWTYRLGLEPEQSSAPQIGNGTLWFTIAMTFAAFFFFRIPDWAGLPSYDWFVPYIAPVFLLPLMAYHTTIHRAWGEMRAFWSLAIGLLALYVVADFYWGNWPYPSYEWRTNSETGRLEYLDVEDPFALVRQAQTLVQIHFPLLLWGLLGYVYTRLSAGEERVDFVRHSVQVGLFAFIVGLAGGALMALTAGLLSLLDYPESFFENLAIWGLCGLPFFGHYLWVTNKQILEKILPTLARIFIPLFLLVVLIFLVTYLGQGLTNLRENREQLFIFNLLLILVIGLVMMHYAFEEEKHPAITLGVGALVALTLVADGIGLWAIGSRMLEFGLTPNRITVLVGNILFAVALGGVLWVLVKAPNGAAAPVRRMLNTMLGLFVAWTLVVVVLFPLVYGRYDSAEKAQHIQDNPLRSYSSADISEATEEATMEDIVEAPAPVIEP